MKRILSILMVALTLCYPLAVIAQPEPGTFSITPKVGVTASTLTGNPQMEVTIAEMQIPEENGWVIAEGPIVFLYGFSTDQNKMRYGWNAGVEFSYQLAKRWAFAAEVQYSLQGNRFETIDSSTAKDFDYIVIEGLTLNLHYINVPIMTRYYLLPDLAIEAGLQPAYSFRQKGKGDITVGDNKTHMDSKVDVIRAFDFSVPVGLTYELGHFKIDARYNIGLTNVYAKRWNSYSNKPSARNSVFQLSLGYRFDL